MLMKWMDLEPGDKIKISKEAEDKWSNMGDQWLDRFCNKILVVDSIKERYEVLYIFFLIEGEDSSLSPYRIYVDKICGKYLNTTIFEIVELKED